MSWYVDYYLGYKTKEGKIYPLGIFDSFGEIHPILTKSRSFASNLWEQFQQVSLEETTDELRKYFYNGNPYSYEEESDEDRKKQQVWCFWLDIDNLPKGDGIKRGYFLQEEISRFERTGDDSDLFWLYLTPEEYVRKMEAELKFGIPKPKTDCEGNEIEEHSCGEYSYYIVEDYCSAEYEATCIRRALDVYEFAKIPKGSKFVVLETHG